MEISHSQEFTEASLSFILNESNKRSNDSHLECSGKQKAFELCINEHCEQKSRFTCSDESCKCQEDHNECLGGKIFRIHKLIQNKLLNTEDMKNHIEKTVDKMIDQLSSLKENLLTKLENELKYSQLFEKEREFLKIIEEGTSNNCFEQNFTSTDSILLWKMVNKKFIKESELFNDTKTILKNLEKWFKECLERFNSTLDELVKIDKKTYETTLHQLESQIVEESVVNRSSIVKNVEHARRLINFFPHKIKKLKLLYRASEYDFSIAKYYELCEEVTNTVILCESNKGKIVGGFTPFCHYQQKLEWDFTFISDPEKNSFLFSLTNNDKFEFVKQECAIQLSKNKERICFGNGEILIADKANTNSDCQLCFNFHYKNENYKWEDMYSRILFSGNELANCTLNEWEVWRVEME